MDGDDIDGRGGVKRFSAMFPRSPSIQSVKSLLGSLGTRSKSKYPPHKFSSPEREREREKESIRVVCKFTHVH